jgi:intein/homing endonuclease
MLKELEELIRVRVARDESQRRRKIVADFTDIVDTTILGEEIVEMDHNVKDTLRGYYLIPNWREIPRLAMWVPGQLINGRAILSDDMVFIRDLLEWSKEVGISYSRVTDNSEVRVFPVQSSESIKTKAFEVDKLKKLLLNNNVSEELVLSAIDEVEIMLLQTAFVANNEDDFADNLRKVKEHSHVISLLNKESYAQRLLRRLSFLEKEIEDRVV